ncbi:MAG: DUF4010 domain-containing protein [Candidatus Micrarchaeota archaeon]
MDFSFISSTLLALALGALIGLERERSGSATLGLRSFALVSFFGFVVTLIGSKFIGNSLGLVVGIGFVGVLLLSLLYYYFRALHGVHVKTMTGLTTTVAVPLTFLLGVLVGLNLVVEAVTSAIAIALLLVERQKLHSAVKTITMTEIVDGLVFAIIAFVIQPLIPMQLQVFMGYSIDLQLAWKIVVIGSLLSFVAHLLTKYLHEKGALLAAFFGGAVSSLGVIYLFLHYVAKQPSAVRLALVASSAGAYVADVIFLLFVSPVLFFSAGLAVTAVSIVLLLLTWVYSREADLRGVVFSKPLSLAFVAEFAILFFLVKLLSDFLTAYFGETGLLVSSFLGGLASSSAVFAAAVALFSQGTITVKQAALSMIIGLSGSMIVKTFLVASKLKWKEPVKVFAPLLISLAIGFLVFYLT